MAVYETAPVFLPTPDRLRAPILGVDRRPDDDALAALLAAVPRQPLMLGAVLAGERQASGWWGGGRPVSWADAVQVVRELARVLGVDVEVERSVHPPWHPGRCARLSVLGEPLGHAGELHPSVCTAYGVPARTAALEVDLDLLIAASPLAVQAPALSTYPVAKEDVALVVDADLPAAVLARTLGRAPVPCWSRCGSSTSTPASRSARAGSRWPSR